jgi:hypothetical protein
MFKNKQDPSFGKRIFAAETAMIARNGLQATPFKNKLRSPNIEMTHTGANDDRIG